MERWPREFNDKGEIHYQLKEILLILHKLIYYNHERQVSKTLGR